MKGYLSGQSCAPETFQYEVFQLVVELKGVQMAVFLEGGGEADGGIACKGAEFENAGSSRHLSQHTQELALRRAGEHSGVVGPDMGLLHEPPQCLVRTRRMVFDVFIYLFHNVSVYLIGRNVELTCHPRLGGAP